MEHSTIILWNGTDLPECRTDETVGSRQSAVRTEQLYFSHFLPTAFYKKLMLPDCLLPTADCLLPTDPTFNR